MTDFVVSRVAMSVCALLVAGSMGGMIDTSMKPDPGDDLGRVLASLQETVASVASHGGAATLSWTVPSLPSGSPVHISFERGSVLARSEGSARAAATCPMLHTWSWDGRPLNATTVLTLDSCGPILEAWTSQMVEISAAEVLVDDSPEVLVFVA